MLTKVSDKQRILKLLQTRDRVSSYDLIKVTHRYSAHIHTLRNEGYAIEKFPDSGSMWRKANPKLCWYVLGGRFEINSRN